jgi:hypothetical protein
VLKEIITLSIFKRELEKKPVKKRNRKMTEENKEPANKMRGCKKKLHLERKTAKKAGTEEETQCHLLVQSIAEDWIQYFDCKEWAHENCVEFERFTDNSCSYAISVKVFCRSMLIFK